MNQRIMEEVDKGASLEEAVQAFNEQYARTKRSAEELQERLTEIAMEAVEIQREIEMEEEMEREMENGNSKN